MPYTMNGIGTRYAGKSNFTVRRGVCAKCGRETDLKSYQTRLWFCIFFIPIIPLGRRQVVDFCPGCTAHRVANLHEWQQTAQKAIAEATRSAKESPGDLSAHLKLHATLQAFQRVDEAQQLAEALPGMFPQSTELHLYLAAWYGALNNTTAQGRHLERALEIDPDCSDARKVLGLLRLHEGNMPAAGELLASVIEPGPEFMAGVCAAVGEGYLEAGKPAEAMALLERALEAQPELGQDRAVRRAVKECEKQLAKPSSILPPSRRARRWRFALVALALVAVGVPTGLSLHKRAHQTLHIVNALAEPVKVQIDGGPPLNVRHGHAKVPLAEGDHTGLVTMPDGRKREVSFRVENGFRQRLAGGNIFVLNVAGAGTVMEDEIVYAENPNGVAPPVTRFHWGDEFLVLRGVDYPFVPAPKSISRERGSRPVRRWCVSLVEAPPMLIMEYALAQEPVDERLAFAERHLDLDPDDEGLLGAYVGSAVRDNQVARCRAFLQKGLSARPVSLTWHICYQGLSFQVGAGQEVQAQYAEMLADEPENGALAFLAGRATADPVGAARLFDRAAEADPDLPWPWLQKAMQAATTGDMAAAREAAATARRLAPDREEIADVLFGIRCALGDYGGLEDKLRRETAKGLEAGFRNWDRLMQVLGVTGQKEEVRAVHKAFMQAIGNATEFREFRLEAATRAALCYWLDDADGCRSAAKEATDATVFYPACSWGLLRWSDLDAAAAYAQKAPGADLPAHLLMLSLACRRQGEAGQAADALERALDSLDHSGFSGQALARLLRSEDDVDRAALDAVAGRLISKAAALVILAERQPAQAPEFLDLAETLSRTDPYAQRFLAPFIAAARQQAATTSAAAAGG